MAITDVVLKRRSKAGARGYQYEVWRDGTMLLASRDPEFATCRFLANEGISGTVRFWREGADDVHTVLFPSMTLNIQRGAKISTTEGQRQGAHFVKYNDFWDKKPEEEELDEAA